ncbi:MAG: DsbA family protein [Proteobacteria bacterium]|nr:DsbA family protein [Pseudomonadota bacterium]
MMRLRSFVLAAVAGVLLAVPCFAETPAAPASAPAASSSFTDKQKTDLEQIIRDVLQKNPEIIVNAAQAFQMKQAQEADKKAAEAVVQYKDQLFNDPKDPVEGNPKGTVQIVEFFDYNCGFCKKAHDPILELVKAEKDVKLVYKQMPILADSSKVAAKAALGAAAQGKYIAMHNALMEHKGSLDDATIMDIATKVGVDRDKLKKDMESPEVAGHLAVDMDLANKLGAHGTPTFVFGDKVVPGAMSLEEMKKLVDEERQKQKKG